LFANLPGNLLSINTQRIIGITGGIASGKTTVANYLSERYDLPVLDTDRYAKQVLEGEVLGQVFQRYQARVLAENLLVQGKTLGQVIADLDRFKLGQIIFSDPTEKQWLESLVHPLVRDRLLAELKRYSAERVVVAVIPLLFEVGWQDLVTETWLVYCPGNLQKQRLMQRNHLTAEDAQLRLDSQMQIEAKVKLADVVIDNSVDFDFDPNCSDRPLYAQIDSLLA
jgi:dephospho-CoA kinase